MRIKKLISLLGLIVILVAAFLLALVTVFAVPTKIFILVVSVVIFICALLVKLFCPSFTKHHTCATGG
ncbi:MAG: hypothetical protein ACRC4W_06450 [Treponemataceae bacterium]